MMKKYAQKGETPWQPTKPRAAKDFSRFWKTTPTASSPLRNYAVSWMSKPPKKPAPAKAPYTATSPSFAPRERYGNTEVIPNPPTCTSTWDKGIAATISI